MFKAINNSTTNKLINVILQQQVIHIVQHGKNGHEMVKISKFKNVFEKPSNPPEVIEICDSPKSRARWRYTFKFNLTLKYLN